MPKVPARHCGLSVDADGGDIVSSFDGCRWQIVRRRANILRWAEHIRQPLYVWMVEPPRLVDRPVTLYRSFEDARLAFVRGVHNER